MVHSLATFTPWVERISKSKSAQPGAADNKSPGHHKMHKAPAQFAAGAMGMFYKLL